MERLTSGRGRTRFAGGLPFETDSASWLVDAGYLGGLETALFAFGERETAAIEIVPDYSNCPSCNIHRSPAGALSRPHSGQVETGI